MKQMEVTEKKIGENTFYIKPFPAFTAVNLSGELAAIITPLLASVAPFFGNAAGDTSADLMDKNVEDLAPALSGAFSNLSGEKFEKLMRKLLIDHNNISVECAATDGDVKVLTYDLANEVFCGDVQDMYVLCFHVIRMNFGGFFKKLGARFGNLQGLLQTVSSKVNTEN